MMEETYMEHGSIMLSAASLSFLLGDERSARNREVSKRRAGKGGELKEVSDMDTCFPETRVTPLINCVSN